MKNLIILFVMLVNFVQSARAELFDIGPFPLPGSIEEAIDVKTLLFYQSMRSQEDCDYAAAESDDVSLQNFFGGKHGLLTDDEIKKANRKMITLKAKALYKIVREKERYDRPRPYDSHPEIQPCIEKEASASYPSGHSMFGRMYARVLSFLHPERAILLMKRGNEIGENRMIGGVHYPSDVRAGQKLGDELADNYINVL